ncbi:SPOR domain-containing protein [Alteromonadaceae bacterium BrNp21-10]|nr:SPOR domain-containing protein [Alteromonadaceae bacterium BrNp21-10]
MAPKDYVSRGKTTAPEKKPAKPSLPWPRLLITAILIGGFGYFLWSINGTAPKEEQSPIKEIAQELDPLPAAPEEQWEFIESLDQQDIEVELPEEVEDGDTRPYIMQCGSFRRETQAEEMRAKLAFSGLEAQVRASNGKNGLWHRVVLGPYDSKRDAERHRHQARKLKIATCQIWRGT